MSAADHGLTAAGLVLLTVAGVCAAVVIHDNQRQRREAAAYVPAQPPADAAKAFKPEWAIGQTLRWRGTYIEVVGYRSPRGTNHPGRRRMILAIGPDGEPVLVHPDDVQ